MWGDRMGHRLLCFRIVVRLLVVGFWLGSLMQGDKGYFQKGYKEIGIGCV